MITFGQKLRELRKERRKSQTEVATEIADQYGDRVRMSQTTFSALENSEDIPDNDVLEILADYFRVSMDYFNSPKNLDAALDYLEALRNGECNTADAPAGVDGMLSVREMRVSRGAYSEDEFFDT